MCIAPSFWYLALRAFSPEARGRLKEAGSASLQGLLACLSGVIWLGALDWTGLWLEQGSHGYSLSSQNFPERLRLL